MGQLLHTIAIHSATPSGGCGGCVPSAAAGPVCRSVLGEPCASPDLQGPAVELQRLLAALAPVLGQPGAPGLVQALHVQPGEVELTLGVPAGCGGALLADSAFQLLRRLLPDTDIYVHHAGFSRRRRPAG